MPLVALPNNAGDVWVTCNEPPDVVLLRIERLVAQIVAALAGGDVPLVVRPAPDAHILDDDGILRRPGSAPMASVMAGHQSFADLLAVMASVYGMVALGVRRTIRDLYYDGVADDTYSSQVRVSAAADTLCSVLGVRRCSLNLVSEGRDMPVAMWKCRVGRRRLLKFTRSKLWSAPALGCLSPRICLW